MQTYREHPYKPDTKLSARADAAFGFMLAVFFGIALGALLALGMRP